LTVFDACLGHTNFDRRCYPCSCCCPFFRMLVLYSRPMKCLSMLLSSICVWRCPRTVYLRCQMFLSCHWQSLLHFFPTSSSTSKCRLRLHHSALFIHICQHWISVFFSVHCIWKSKGWFVGKSLFLWHVFVEIYFHWSVTC